LKTTGRNILPEHIRNVTILFILLLAGCAKPEEQSFIGTVNGPIETENMGITLTHEHILVDFIGADSTGYHRWNRTDVVKVVLPYLREIKELGCQTLVDCTPAYIGRDPLLLKILSDSSGLNILTNTGLYGARNNKFLPPYAFCDSADKLAKRWIAEYQNGIEGTGIKPGLIKIGVDDGRLSGFHRKLITAAARTHLATGLAIASHTGPAVPAFEQLEILEREGVSANAFIWVHAQAEKDLAKHVQAAQKGAWISLDGIGEDNLDEYLAMIENLKDHGLLNRALISHDAGWYSPGEENGGSFRGYTTIFEEFIPLLKEMGFSEENISQLLEVNPGEAFAIRVREK